MNKDENLLKLMQQVDGSVNHKDDLIDTREVEDLKKILSKLKALPLASPDAITDQQISKFIRQNKQAHTNVIKSKWWPWVLMAASIVLVIYLLLPEKLSKQYASIGTNPEKIGFLYGLNKEELNKEELTWLVSLLDDEDHPNIRVILIDLIGRKGYAFPKEFSACLVNENVPTVQLALLNSINKNNKPEIKEKLLAFNKRNDLDPMVQKRVQEILSQK
jgi:hypothetical protein